jgi:hypothetical protein
MEEFMVEEQETVKEDAQDDGNENSVVERVIPIDSESEDKADLEESSNNSSDESEETVEQLKQKIEKLENSRRTLQSRTDTLTDTLVKNAQLASKYGLKIDDKGTPLGKQDDTRKSPEIDQNQISELIEARFQKEEHSRIESETRKAVLELYPDLNDESSDLFAEASKIIEERPHLNSVHALRDIAELATFNLAMKHKPELEKLIQKESVDKQNRSSAFMTESSASTSSQEAGEGLTSEQREYYKGKGQKSDKEIKRLEKIMKARIQKGAYQIDVI